MFETKTVNQIEIITLSNQYGKAEVSTMGAHVMSWIPANEKPVLWMSKKSYFEPGKPIRGGIPVCWPWFGGVKKPNHGFARLETWQTVGIFEQENGSTQLVLALDKADLADFPFHAQLTVTLGKCLEVSLSVENKGTTPVKTSEALHTYFAVSDVANIRISGLDGAEYEDKCPSAAQKYGKQDGEIAINSEFDNVYTGNTSDVIYSDIGTGRSILVEKFGSCTTVVWNPWIDKAAAMPDFGDQEFHKMVCIEAANALADSVVLYPGVIHTIAQKLTVL